MSSSGGRASIRWRLTGWYVATLAVALVVVSLGSFLVLSRVLAYRLDRFLEEARGAYVAELEVEFEELGTVRAAVAAAVRDTRFSDTWVVVIDRAGTPMTRDDAARPRRGLAMPATVLSGIERLGRAPLERLDFRTVGDADDQFRVALAPVVVGGERLIVAAARTRRDERETLEQVALGYLAVTLLALGCAAIGGYLLARRALAPMASLAARTRTIEASNLDQRVEAPNPDDEVGTLATVINALLDRLQHAFTMQGRFVADASHELRTPVATICAEAEVALDAPDPTVADQRESLAVIRDAGRRLAHVVDELFLLARIDAGRLPLARQPIYLDEMLTDLSRSVRALARSRQITVAVEPAEEAPWIGDPTLVERMLLNLLDNALKFSPPGSTVRVRLERRPDAYLIIVGDSGPGVPEQDRERIFERFFRTDPSRSRRDDTPTGGAGLGLAIARWVAVAHAGTVQHRPPPAGLSGSDFVATLPRLPA